MKIILRLAVSQTCGIVGELHRWESLVDSGGCRIELQGDPPLLLPPPASPSLFLPPQICMGACGGSNGVRGGRGAGASPSPHPR